MWVVPELHRPVRLAIVDDYAVVVAGVASFLATEMISVVETGASKSVVSDVDIVLYDTFGQIEGTGIDLEDFVRDSEAKVVIYSWNLEPQLIKQALAQGARGYLSKVLTGPEIVHALERVMRDEIVVLTGEEETSVGGVGDWPGKAAGLSSREAEVIALDSTCTHLGCRVSWDAEAKLLRCPCHGGVYDTTGAVKAGPPPRALARLMTRIEDGQVQVQL